MSVSVTAAFTKQISKDVSDLQIFKKHHAELRGTKIFLYPNETELTVRKLPLLQILHRDVQQWAENEHFSIEES